MKKEYYILLLLLTACTKAPQVEEQREFITFDTRVEGMSAAATRAKEFGYWQAGMKLNVVCYETNTTRHFNDFDMTYYAPYTTSWSYSPAVETPKVSLSFYAYYNGLGVSNFAADGFTGGFDYTVQVPNEDIFVSKAVSSSARVAMFFFHPLAEVNFAVQGHTGYKINVYNIRVNDVKNTGHLTMSTWGGGTWSNVSGQMSYAYTPDNPASLPTSGADDALVYLGNHGGGVPGENDRDNALMLMPQSFTATSGTVSFHYTGRRTDDTLYKEGDVELPLSQFASNVWEQSKRYLYIIDCAGVIEPTTRGEIVGVRCL